MASQPALTRAPSSGNQRLLQRGEQIAAVFLLMILSPFLIAAGIVVLLLSHQSPLVAHCRVGLHGRAFWLLKFRTMWPTGKHWRLCWFDRVVDEPADLKIATDPRITSRFARFCRRFSIDEIPQLINIARGEMAFVGPRPLTREELVRHYGADTSEVLSVLPGITGLWQVKGRNRLSYAERRRQDLILVRDYSMRLYLMTLLKTIPAVLSGRDSW